MFCSQKRLTVEEGPSSWCPANMYIYLPPITQAVDPDMGGGMSPLVSTCFLKTQLFNDKWLALRV